MCLPLCSSFRFFLLFFHFDTRLLMNIFLFSIFHLTRHGHTTVATSETKLTVPPSLLMTLHRECCFIFFLLIIIVFVIIIFSELHRTSHESFMCRRRSATWLLPNNSLPLPPPVTNPTVVERPCRHFGVCALAHTSLKLAHDIVKLDHATGGRTRIIPLAYRVDHNATSKGTFPLRQHSICQLAHSTTPERV